MTSTVAVGADRRRPPSSTPHAWRVLAVCSLGVFLVFLDTTIVNIAFDAIKKDFRASTSGLSWVLNAYSILFAALLVPVGRIADQVGRRKVFIAGLVGVRGDLRVLRAGQRHRRPRGLPRPAGGGRRDGGAHLAGVAAAGVPARQAVPGRRSLGGDGGGRCGIGSITRGAAGRARQLAVGLLRERAGLRARPGRGRSGCSARARTRTPTASRIRPASSSSSPPSACCRWASSRARRGAGATRGSSARSSGPSLLFAAFVTADPDGQQPRPGSRDCSACVPTRPRTSARCCSPSRSTRTGICNILFLQHVWHYSVLKAALSVTPGSDHRRHRRRPGGQARRHLRAPRRDRPGRAALRRRPAQLRAARDSGKPDYLGAWLVRDVLRRRRHRPRVRDLRLGRGGVAAAAPVRDRRCGQQLELPAARAPSSASPLFVAVLGTPHTPGAALTAFHHDWTVIGAIAFASALVGLMLPRHPKKEVFPSHVEVA